GILAMANVTGDGAGAARPSGPNEHNRAVTDVYEPGSTNKVITMAGALEDGLVQPETKFTVPDKLPMANAVFEDHEPHPPIPWSVTDILVNSSNVGTIMVGQKLGKNRLDHYLRAFGFGTRTGVGFPGEPAGLLLDPDHWYVTSMGTVPIGNGLAVSALQMLQVYTTVANGGLYRPPRLVEATIDADGVRHPVPMAEPRRVISPETAGKLSTMLTKVVQEGTGTNAAVPGYLSAGKTGTARKPLEGARGYSGNYVASFVGYVPAQDPRLAAVVVLDEPTPIYGGQVSAPVFARIMQYALRLDRIPPPPGSPPPVAAGAPAHALDEEQVNDDPNVAKSTTTTTKPKSTVKSSTTTTTAKGSTTTTTRPKATTRSSTTTTTARGSTSKSSTTTTTRPRSASASSSTTTTRPKSAAASSSTTTTRPKSATTSSSTTTSSTGGASGGRQSDTLGRGEGGSGSPSSGQSNR
ncbi:MAG TPA: penicillin-binding protein 2, partial [Acidimicrobiia bacterium]|nr:penicillin-binding protein 2 [Acidimicrobiia bacterium]